MAERKPLFDDRIPRPFREMIKELKAMRALLEEIKAGIAVPVPRMPPVAVPRVLLKKPVFTLNMKEFRDMLLQVAKAQGPLTFSEDLYVETVSLEEARDEPKEFPHLKGLALTIFRNTGTFDLYINKMSADHKITIDALTYPQTLLIDWFRIKSLWIKNTAQSGLEAVLIAWKRPILRLPSK